jgi:hypothetical protein
MVFSWFSSDAYPKLGVFQIVANQSRQLDIWRSLNEGDAPLLCSLRFPLREEYRLCPDGRRSDGVRGLRGYPVDGAARRPTGGNLTNRISTIDDLGLLDASMLGVRASLRCQR